MQFFPADEPEQSDSTWYWRGLRHAASMYAVVLAATFIGIGSLCRDADMPLLWSVLATFFVWAGPAHVILVAGLSHDAPALSIAIAVTLSSLRLLPMVMSLMPYLRLPKRPQALLMLAGHAVAISAWVEGMRVLPHLVPKGRVPFFLGFSTGLMMSALLATVLGYYLAGVIPLAARAGLLFLTPMFFLLSMLAGLHRLLDVLAIIFGFFGLLLASPFFGTLDLLVAGLGGGTLAYGIARVRGRGDA